MLTFFWNAPNPLLYFDSWYMNWKTGCNKSYNDCYYIFTLWLCLPCKHIHSDNVASAYTLNDQILNYNVLVDQCWRAQHCDEMKGSENKPFSAFLHYEIFIFLMCTSRSVIWIVRLGHYLLWLISFQLLPFYSQYEKWTFWEWFQGYLAFKMLQLSYVFADTGRGMCVWGGCLTVSSVHLNKLIPCVAGASAGGYT